MNPSTPTIEQKGTAMGFLLCSGVVEEYEVCNALNEDFPRPVVWGWLVGNRNGLAGMVMCAGRGMFI